MIGHSGFLRFGAWDLVFICML